MIPTLENLSELSDAQIESKIMKINGLYFMTDNDYVRQQMILLLDTFKLELEERRLLARKKQQEQNGKDDLDGLIKVR
jgi:hypothetical protein